MGNKAVCTNVEIIRFTMGLKHNSQSIQRCHESSFPNDTQQDNDIADPVKHNSAVNVVSQTTHGRMITIHKILS